MKKYILNLVVVLVSSIYFFSTDAFGQRDEMESIGNVEGVVMPNYHYDYVPDFTYQEVADRIQAMNLEMPFELNDRVFSFIQYFTVRNREYIKMVLARKEQYFPMYEETMRDHEMPSDIIYLSIVESGLDPKIKSKMGAVGLWQFMPATGRMYGMQANTDMDDRMDPEKSTVAAAKYLKSLYKMFGNWEVALAAYNCGPGNVRKAIRRSGGKTTFWGIYDHLPKETRSYVPQFQAMLYVLNHLEEHNLHLEEPSYPLEYESISFNRAFNLERMADLSRICLADLEKLNPSIKTRQIPESHQTIALRIPKSKVLFVKENLAWISDSLGKSAPLLLAANPALPSSASPEAITSTASRLTYKVKSGDALGKIASRHGVSISQLRSWNNLNSSLIKVGQILIIHTGKEQSTVTSSALALNEVSASSSKTYTVQPGDSLWIISKKHSLTIEQIKRLNNLNSTNIKPGQRLIIG
ncbi:MAG: LysM peptidoglycan-binding domain-containing protein [Algoriphagus sp.]|nr:LysM peptidoglycan-binding domain-containing protein [Algoriphagus sp.]